MANIGTGLLGQAGVGAATGAATGAASGAASGALQGGVNSAVTSGLAKGALNGLTDFGKKVQEVQNALGGGQGGGEIPQAPPMNLAPSYGAANGEALANYVMQLLNRKPQQPQR